MDEYNIFNLYNNDTYEGVQFTISVNGTPFDLSSTAIRSEIRRSNKKGTIVRTMTDGSGITITDAPNGVFVIDPFVVDFGEGTYYYDIQLTTDATVKTYIKGIMKVVEDVTK